MADNTLDIVVQDKDVLEVSVKDNNILASIEEQQINVEVDKVVEISGGSSDDNRTIHSFGTAQNINIHRAVALDSDGELIYADNNDITTLNRLIGISLQSVLKGEGCNVLILGDMTDPSFTLSGDSVYVGTSGDLLTTPPSAGYAQKIGTVINATTIYVEKEMPIKLV